MGAPFPNEVAGGNGVLLIPAIQSPNFSIADQTGWAIMQNGDAFFYDITAKGNITAGELFLYNGTPAKGSLFLSIAPSAGSDDFGNNYGQGFNMGAWSATTGNQEQHFGIDNQGNLYLADSAGLTRIFVSPVNSDIAFYDNGSPQNLLLSLAAQAGTDPNTGQPVPQGLKLYSAGNGSYVLVSNVGGVAAVNLSGGAAAESVAGHLWCNVQGGTVYNEEVGLTGTQLVSPNNDYVWIGLQSAQSDGSGRAGGNLYYVNTSGAQRALLEWGAGGMLSPGLNDNIPMTVGEAVLTKDVDQTVNTFGFQVLTGLNCNMAANSSYLVEGHLVAENLTAAVNDLWACVFPAGSTVALWGWFAQNAVSGPIVTTTNSGGTFTSPAYGVGVTYQFHFGGVVKTGASSGTFSVQGSESAAGDTWKAFANWYVRIRRMSGG